MRHSVHNSPSSQFRHGPHLAPGRSNAGTSRMIQASPSESPGASRAWRSPHWTQQHSALRWKPMLHQRLTDWSPSLTQIRWYEWVRSPYTRSFLIHMSCVKSFGPQFSKTGGLVSISPAQTFNKEKRAVHIRFLHLRSHKVHLVSIS